MDSMIGNDVSPKWIKQKMLTMWRLRESEELASSIHRYNIREYRECLKQIEVGLRVSEVHRIYVIKLIPYNSVYKLPNFLIENPEELKACRDKLRSINIESFMEIWYCENTLQEEKVYGRMLFSLDELFPRIMTRNIEVVWGISARMIEQYPDLTCTFAAVETNGWNQHFRIIKILQADKSKTEIQRVIAVLLKLLGNYQDRIIKFGTFIKECGCSSLCIEFSLEKGERFTIIDWDSDNDMKVICKIIQNKDFLR